jgi:hypothetical protein
MLAFVYREGRSEQVGSRRLHGRETQLFRELVVEVLDVAFLYVDLEYLSRAALKSSSCPMAAMQTISYPSSISHATAEMSASYISQA